MAGREPRLGTATAVVLATVPAADGRPAAALPWSDTTVLGRLLGQLEALDIRHVHVITRAEWEHALDSAVAGLGISARVHASSSVSDDLSTLAEIARTGAGPLVVVHGEIVTHREALAGLLVGPRIVTGILARHGGVPHLAPRTRSTRGRIMSASSPYHAAGRPNTSFLGVLKIGERDRSAAAEVAERLASLTEPPLPPGWEDELERKVMRWRLALASDGASGALVDGDGQGGRATAEASEAGRGREGDDSQDFGSFAPLSAEDEAEIGRRLETLREDVVSLLLVGLVRADVHVANSYLRALFWGRPLSREAARDTAEEIEGYDEDRVLLDSAVKGNDGFFTTFFVSPYSRYIARWAARRGLTPNQVTTLSMAIGVLAAAAFATGSRPGLVAGAVLLQVAFTADCVDGQLARYTRTFSKLGAWLDSVFDRSKEYVVFAGLAIGASRGFGEDVWVLAVAAMTLQTARHMADFAFGTTQHQAIATERRPPLEEPGDAVALRRVRPAALPTSPPGANGDAGPGAISAPTGPSPSPLLHAEPAADVPPRPAPPLARRIVRGLVRRAIALSRTLERWPWARWAKKILVFPIGERFAVISLTAALFTPETTFIVVLAWGGVATLYTLAGRSIRSLSR